MFKGWTYGAELELSDFPRARLAEAGLQFDREDVTMVNSNGVAVDARGVLYPLGGEVKVRPSDSPDGVAAQLAEIVRLVPETAVNYRSNLHVHVAVPGLRDDLTALKRVQRHVHGWLPGLLAKWEPIPEPRPEDYPHPEALAGARRRRNRRRMSHQKFLPEWRLDLQDAATSPRGFFTAEALDVKTGKVHFAIATRAAINLRSLLDNGTIECRHYPGTLDPAALANAVNWSRTYLAAALEDADPRPALAGLDPFPRFGHYIHWMEVGFMATSRKYNKAPVIAANIVEWLEGGGREAAQAEFGL